jgi:uncharacterized protein (DUF983 family)
MNEPDIQTIAVQGFMSLWQGYCDLKQISRDLMMLVDGRCPECHKDQLHSAHVDGKEGISCGACDWSTSYEALRSKVP